VEELIGTERLVDFPLVSLLLGFDGGNVACEAVLTRVVLWVFCLTCSWRRRGCSLWNKMSHMS